jgi:abortive infection bacteriophage resistance protein
MTEGVQKTISYFSTTQHSASDHFLPDKAFQNARRTFLKTLSKKISLSLVVSTSRQIEIEIENVLSVETNF